MCSLLEDVHFLRHSPTREGTLSNWHLCPCSDGICQVKRSKSQICAVMQISCGTLAQANLQKWRVIWERNTHTQCWMKSIVVWSITSITTFSNIKAEDIKSWLELCHRDNKIWAYIQLLSMFSSWWRTYNYFSLLSRCGFNLALIPQTGQIVMNTKQFLAGSPRQAKSDW